MAQSEASTSKSVCRLTMAGLVLLKSSKVIKVGWDFRDCVLDRDVQVFHEN